MKKIIFECLIIITVFIAWRFGIISLAWFGDIMIGFGVLGFVLAILGLIDFQTPAGDASYPFSIAEAIGIKKIDGKPPTTNVILALALGVIPLVIGLLIQLFS